MIKRTASRLIKLGLTSMRRAAIWAVRWGLLGLVAGVLSWGMADSRMIYGVRAQKTCDHIVWPGLVFALIVVLPISRLARDGWPRTAAAAIALAQETGPDNLTYSYVFGRFAGVLLRGAIAYALWRSSRRIATDK